MKTFPVSLKIILSLLVFVCANILPSQLAEELNVMYMFGACYQELRLSV